MSKKPKGLWKYPLALLIGIIHFIPIYILIGVAFKAANDNSSKWQLPGYINWENFRLALTQGNIGRALTNTLIITAASVILIVLIGSLAAYPLTRNKSKLNSLVTAFIMGVMMVPPLSILVPLYSTMTKFGGISTYWGIIVILVTFQLPMSIFLFKNFIEAIPIALEEAAAIDGCSKTGIFFRIILPQLKPVIASVAIITGVNCWNDYQFSLYLLQSPDVKNITLAISGFFSQSASNVNAAAASALLGILPVILVFLFFQKYFIRGMVDSAIK